MARTAPERGQVTTDGTATGNVRSDGRVPAVVAGPLRDRRSLRTVGLVALGAAGLLVLTAVGAAVRESFRPHRGC